MLYCYVAIVKKLSTSIATDEDSIASLQKQEDNLLKVLLLHVTLHVHVPSIAYMYHMIYIVIQAIESIEAEIEELQTQKLSVQREFDDQVIH